jgi:hypothetical protein
MSTDISWVKTFSRNNLGAIYSILIDIKERAEFDSGEIEIPLLPPHDRSDLLYPGGGIRNEEAEGEKRQLALEFLQKRGLIRNLHFNPGLFVSETTVALELVSSALFDTTFAAVEAAIEGKPGAESNKSSPSNGEFWPRIHPKITEIARPRAVPTSLNGAIRPSDSGPVVGFLGQPAMESCSERAGCALGFLRRRGHGRGGRLNVGRLEAFDDRELVLALPAGQHPPPRFSRGE